MSAFIPCTVEEAASGRKFYRLQLLAIPRRGDLLTVPDRIGEYTVVDVLHHAQTAGDEPSLTLRVTEKIPAMGSTSSVAGAARR